MGLLKMRRATVRNTPAFWVMLGDVRILFSFESAVALEDPKHQIYVRRKNHWGVTTERHLREGGASAYNEISDDDFEQAVGRALVTAIKLEGADHE